MKTDIDSVIKRIKDGDDVAFAELKECYDPLIVSMASSFAETVSKSDTSRAFEDLSQEATLALYRAAVRFEKDERGNGKVSFGLYAKVCIRNALISVLRRMNKKITDERRIADNTEDEREKQFPRLPDAINVRDIAEGDILSDYEKKIFLMYVQGMKIRDIAAAVGKSSKSVSNAVFRIKTKLRCSIAQSQE